MVKLEPNTKKDAALFQCKIRYLTHHLDCGDFAPIASCCTAWYGLNSCKRVHLVWKRKLPKIHNCFFCGLHLSANDPETGHKHENIMCFINHMNLGSFKHTGVIIRLRIRTVWKQLVFSSKHNIWLIQQGLWQPSLWKCYIGYYQAWGLEDGMTKVKTVHVV